MCSYVVAIARHYIVLSVIVMSWSSSRLSTCTSNPHANEWLCVVCALSALHSMANSWFPNQSARLLALPSVTAAPGSRASKRALLILALMAARPVCRD